MKVHGESRRTLHPEPGGAAVVVIDQRCLPHRLELQRLTDLASVTTAIRHMWVRGAPLIGVTAAYGLAMQARDDASDAALDAAATTLIAARPTAVNLAWAVDDCRQSDTVVSETLHLHNLTDLCSRYKLPPIASETRCDSCKISQIRCMTSLLISSSCPS